VELFFVFLTLFGLLILRVPIFASLAGATIVGILLEPRLTMLEVVRNSIIGIDSLVLFAAPLFVLAGNLILVGGVSQRLIGWVDNLFGFSRLRLVYVNVFGSMFFGGISGSATADSAAIGSVLVPERKRQGFPTAYSAAVTAASSGTAATMATTLATRVWVTAITKQSWLPPESAPITSCCQGWRRNASSGQHPSSRWLSPV